MWSLKPNNKRKNTTPPLPLKLCHQDGAMGKDSSYTLIIQSFSLVSLTPTLLFPTHFLFSMYFERI